MINQKFNFYFLLLALSSITFQLLFFETTPTYSKSTDNYLGYSGYSDLEMDINMVGHKNIHESNVNIENSIVKINGPVSSSGVIIGRSNDVYFVITTLHSVNTKSEYTIYTHDGRSYDIALESYGEKVRPMPEGIDLAIVEFRSNRIYQVATLSPGEIDRSTPVHVVGWPEGTLQNPESSIFGIEGIVSQSRIISFEDGYQFAHNVPTRNGMSGGGVFNQDGHLIGIHGRRDGFINPDSNAVEIDPSSNWAIPIDNFLKLAFDDVIEAIVYRSDNLQPRSSNGSYEIEGLDGPIEVNPTSLSGQIVLSRIRNSTNICVVFDSFPKGLPSEYRPYFTAWAEGGDSDIAMEYSSTPSCQGGYVLSRSMPSNSFGGTLSIHDDIGLLNYVLVGSFSVDSGSGCSDVGVVLASVINWRSNRNREHASDSNIPISGDYGWVCQST